MITEHVEALRRLAAEVGGLKAFEPGVREAIGNTNWTVLMQRLDEAEAALSRTAQAPVAVKTLEWEPDHGVASLGPYRLFQAQTPLGRYVYGTDAEGNSYWHSSSLGVFMTGDEATAKRLAEAAWEKTAKAEAGKFIAISALASSDQTPAAEAGGDEVAAQRLAASPLPSSSGTGWQASKGAQEVAMRRLTDGR